MMGVSAAVLDNVIFVHQEDSNWPLSEGALLKKKFDDIFAATKYTKALEHLNKILKEHRQGVKEARLRLETTRAFKSQADTLRAEATETSKSVTLFEEQIVAMESTIRRHEKKMEKLRHVLAATSELRQTRAMLEARFSVQSAALAEAKRAVREETGLFEDQIVTEDVASLTEQYETSLPAQITAAERDVSAMKARVQETSQLVDRLRHAQTTSGQQVATLRAKYETYQSRRRERDVLLSEAGTALGITGLGLRDSSSQRLPNPVAVPGAENTTNRGLHLGSVVESHPEVGGGLLESDQVDHAMESLGQLVARLEGEVVSVTEAGRVAEDAAGRAAAEMVQAVAAAEEAIRGAGRRRTSVETRCEELQATLAGLPTTQTGLEKQRDRENVARKQLEAHQAEGELDSIRAALREKEARLETVQRSVTTLRAKVARCQQSQERNVAVRLRREALTKKEEEREMLVARVRAAIRSAVTTIETCGGSGSSGGGGTSGVSGVVSATPSTSSAAAVAAALLQVDTVPAEDLTTWYQRHVATLKETRSRCETVCRQKRDAASAQEARASAAGSDISRLEGEQVEARKALEGLLESPEDDEIKEVMLAGAGAGAGGGEKEEGDGAGAVYDLDQAISDLASEIGEASHTKELAKNLASWWQIQKKRAGKNKNCTICTRPFATDQEKGEFQARCEQEANKMLTRGARIGGGEEAGGRPSLAQEEARLARYRKARPLYQGLVDVTRRIAAARTDLTGTHIASQRAHMALQEAELALHAAEKAHRALAGDAVSDIVRAATRVTEDIAEVAADLAREEAALARSGGVVVVGGGGDGGNKDHARAGGEERENVGTWDVVALTQSLTEAEAKRHTAEMERDELRRDEARCERQGRQLEDDWRNHKENRLQLESKLQEALQIQEQLAEAKRELERAKTEHAKETARLPGLIAARHQAQSAAGAARAKAEKDREERQSRLRGVVDVLEKATSLARQLEEIGGMGLEGGLQRAEEEHAQTTSRREAAEMEVETARGKLEEESKQLTLLTQLRSDVGVALGMKRVEVEVGQISTQLHRVRAELAQKSQSGDDDETTRELREVEVTLEESKKEANMAKGGLMTLRHRYEELQRQLRQADLRDIDERHRNQEVDEAARELCVSDLEKYNKALEKALLAFHGEKMGEINHTIKELWQKTYRNQDIDYIQIKVRRRPGDGRGRGSGKGGERDLMGKST